MQDHDGDFDKVKADAIEGLREAGLMGSQATMAVLSDFSDKDYENFEVDLEDNQVTMTTYIPVKVRLPEILMTGDRSAPTQEQMRVYNIMLQTLKDFDANKKNISIFIIWLVHISGFLGMVFYDLDFFAGFTSINLFLMSIIVFTNIKLTN